MSLGIQFLAEPIRSLGFASITNSYSSIGTPFQHPVRLIKVDNLTDATLMVSMNGIDNHFILAPNGFFLFDVASNATQAQGWFISEGTQFYVKEIGAAPTINSVYVSVCYGAPVY